MPRIRRGRNKRSRAAIVARIVFGGVASVAFLGLVAWTIVQWRFGGRIWPRVDCWVTVNGRLAIEASVYRSPEGTLLVDLRHAPSHADNEGGGYLVQPFWNRLRAIGKGYYDMHGSWVMVHDIWSPSVELSRDNGLIKIDPKIDAAKDHVSFVGLDNDVVVVHGDVLTRW